MRLPFATPSQITKQLVDSSQQLLETERRFGVPFRLEMIARGFLMTMMDNYQTCTWQFWGLSNGGCYVSPQSKQVYHLIGENKSVSADAAGLICSLQSFSFLSFALDLGVAEKYDSHYSLLLAFIHEHPEALAILDTTR